MAHVLDWWGLQCHAVDILVQQS